MLQIHRALLDTAKAQFYSVGYDQTSMESIAAGAGVSKATLYNRYPGKEALLNAVLEEEFAALLATEGPGPRPADLKQRLRAHSHSTMRITLSTRWREALALINSSGGVGAAFLQLIDAAHKDSVSAIVNDIVECAEDWPVPPRDPERVAQILLAALTGWSPLSSPSISLREALDYADDVVELLYAGRANW